jgi:hypothetical protein
MDSNKIMVIAFPNSDEDTPCKMQLISAFLAGEADIVLDEPGKNNLAPEGEAIGFELDPATGFRWIGTLPITIDELLSGVMPEHDTTYDRAIEFLKTELAKSEKPAAELYTRAAEQDISERTLKKAKLSRSESVTKTDKIG